MEYAYAGAFGTSGLCSGRSSVASRSGEGVALGHLGAHVAV